MKQSAGCTFEGSNFHGPCRLLLTSDQRMLWEKLNKQTMALELRDKKDESLGVRVLQVDCKLLSVRPCSSAQDIFF